MKVVIQNTISLNGMIALGDGSVPFVSERAFSRFRKLMKSCGNYVMGSNTFKDEVEAGSFPYPGVLNVVMTKKKILNKWGDNVLITAASPKEVVRVLRELGFKTMFVGGGSKVNASFLKENLVDECWVDVMPAVVPNGIPWFAEHEGMKRLKMISCTKLPRGEMQVRYSVQK